MTLDSEDPASSAFTAGAPFGLLGIELATRRRNRANGVIASVDARGVEVAIRQSFGNCPQYIQPCDVWPVASGARPVEHLERLDRDAVEAITRAASATGGPHAA